MKLVKLLGPALHEILPVLMDRKASDTEQTEALISAVQKIFSIASPKEVVELIVGMLTSGHTKREGKRLGRSEFEQIYAGDNMVEAYKAFAFVIRVNYGNLLGGQGLGALLAKQEESHTTQSDTPT